MPLHRDNPLLQALGNNIKFYREHLNLSQHDLSVEADIPKNQIGRIERAEINTTILTLHKIAVALKLDIIDLLKE
ncbi:MAG: helix-turn-helix transcriptional regulator [Flavobacteriaceae bacterium]|nr:helix-turn-helix transcriptional regulator [Flavobacteriaceae bacterium]